VLTARCWCAAHLAGTSASPWLNMPAALAVVLGARWAALQLDTRLHKQSAGAAASEGGGQGPAGPAGPNAGLRAELLPQGSQRLLAPAPACRQAAAGGRGGWAQPWQQQQRGAGGASCSVRGSDQGRLAWQGV
jgi:hypothetical protein